MIALGYTLKILDEFTSYNHGGRLYSGYLSLAKERGFS